MASGADVVLESARVFDTVREAVADLHRIYATTARHRDMVKAEVTPRQAATEIRALGADALGCGILFGRERIGLTNDEVVLADAVLHVPLNPDFTSLNLAQAVLLVAYEWFQAGDDTSPRELVIPADQKPAEQRRFDVFFDHLEEALDVGGFFYPPEKKPVTRRSLRNIFQRTRLTDREIQILHGVVVALTGKRRDQLGNDES